MKTITINVYAVSELSKEAKDKAYNKWLEHVDYPWAGENEASLKAFADLFPVTIKNWAYGDRNHGVSFTFTGSDEQAELSGIKLMGHLLHNYFDAIYTGKYYGKLVNTFKDGTPIPKSKEHPAGSRHVKRYSRVLFEDACPTGYTIDLDLSDPIRDFLAKPDNTTFEGLLEKCFSSWVRACESDLEWCTSMEYFEEECEANDRMFDKTGRRIYE